MKQKEEWINGLLGSLDGMQRAPMPDRLRERLLNHIPMARTRLITLKRPSIWLMAAGIALLAGLNVYSLLAHGSKGNDAFAHEANPIAIEYFAAPPSI